MKALLFLFSLSLLGCEMLLDEDVSSESMKVEEAVASSSYELTNLLAQQLAQLDAYKITEKNTVVSTFVWNESLTTSTDQYRLSELGLQLSEQTKHALVQEKARVVETYAGKAVSISDDGTYFLSRDVEDLYQHLNADYVVTGIMSKEKAGIIVNAYVIDFKSKIIVGSAQQFFPNAIFKDENNVTIKDGKLFISREGN